jgi:hypothetical protein
MVKILTDPGCIAQAGLLVKNAMKPEYPELYPYLKLPKMVLGTGAVNMCIFGVRFWCFPQRKALRETPKITPN